MSKFDYNNFYSDDCEWCVCNAKKYTKEQALEALEKMELSPTIRGEALTLEQFAELSNLLKS